MNIYEIGTGYTPIPARMGAATEIVVEELTKAFLKQGLPVEIIDIAAEGRAKTALPIREVPVPKCFRGTDVQLGLMHKLKRVVYSVALSEELKKILKSTDEKVVFHFHNQYNLFFFLKLIPQKLREKVLIAYTVHSYIWHDPWEQIEKQLRKRYFQEMYCIQSADLVYVLNEETRTNIVNFLNVNGDRICLIDNGVNTNVYSVLDDERREKEKLNLGLGSKKILIQVGSVCERKNQLEAVELLRPLMQQDKNLVFCYAGGIIDSAYQHKIEQYAEENGVAEQVRYVGEQKPGESLNAFYNVAEAMVFPSKAEGFSLVVLEAMSAGVPVVIRNNLKFRLSDECMQYHNEESFMEIVNNKLLCYVEQRKLATQARETVVKNFSWEKVAEDYLSTWEC